jgi:hypothetical protein
MTARELPEKFLVAFSFAGEERELVCAIAEEVERRLGPSSVFFDQWYEYYIAGDDSDLRLQKIYGEQSELVVVCVSERYGEKPWTLAEHAAVRARQMQLRVSGVPGDRHRILPIRVGDGDVDGILFNSIVPEVRGKPVVDTAAMIIDRLRLIVPGTKVREPAGHRSWPKEPAPFNHDLADRAVHEWPAVLQLLTAESRKQILLFHGPSGFSKSALLSAASRYAKKLEVSFAYVDFKDTMLLNEANVLLEIQLALGQVLPGFSTQSAPDRWKLRLALRKLQDPALILLDTYEKAAETKDLVDWIETQLLSEAEECPLLRFIIGGQKIPDFAHARWHERAEPVELTAIHDKQIWKDWVRRMDPNVDEKSVEAFVKVFNGVPSNISSTLTSLVEGLKQTP